MPRAASPAPVDDSAPGFVHYFLQLAEWAEPVAEEPRPTRASTRHHAGQHEARGVHVGHRPPCGQYRPCALNPTQWAPDFARTLPHRVKMVGESGGSMDRRWSRYGSGTQVGRQPP